MKKSPVHIIVSCITAISLFSGTAFPAAAADFPAEEAAWDYGTADEAVFYEEAPEAASYDEEPQAVDMPEEILFDEAAAFEDFSVAEPEDPIVEQDTVLLPPAYDDSENTALPDVIDSGACGGVEDDITLVVWELNLTEKDGRSVYTLEINGSGVMQNFEPGEAPWNAYMHTITSFKLGSGVTNLGSNSLNGAINLTSASLSGSLATIGAGAFSGCYRLQGITLPDSVTAIGDEAFLSCSRLGMNGDEPGNLVLPTALTSIGQSAFSGCTGFESVELPDTLTTLGQNAFFGCSSLKAINIGGKIDTINASTFAGCSSLETVEITGETKTIADSAFKDCTSLASFTVTAKSTVKEIGESAFAGCINLSTLNIASRLTHIGKRAFYGCERLEKVSLPDSVFSIGEEAFRGCILMLKFTLPEYVSEIPPYMFAGCRCLQTVNLPIGLRTIGEGAFSGCVSLHTGVPSNTTPYTNHFVIPENVETIGAGAFENCSRMRYVTLPVSLTAIADATFSGCASLANVSLPHENPSATGILTIPDSVIKLGDNAFSGCKKFNRAVLPAKLAEISSDFFEGLTSLDTIEVPADLLCESVYLYSAYYSPEGEIYRYLPSGLTKKTTLRKMIYVSGIKLSKQQLTLRVGESVTVKATVTPKNATDRHIVFQSEDRSVATVSSKGVITAQGPGTTTVWVKAHDTGSVYATCTVKVPREADLPKLNVALNATAKTLYLDSPTAYRSFTIQPEVKNGRILGISFSSGAPRIAWVDKTTGRVTAKGVGTANIIVNVRALVDGAEILSKRICKVTVLNKSLTASLPAYYMLKGDSATFTVNAKPALPVSFRSNNTSVATVSSGGTVRAKGYGTARITVKCNGMTRVYYVTVRRRLE